MQKEFDHKLNTIKWIGIITMLIDHMGYFLFPQLLWMRVIGRIAFPCFLYGIIEGTNRTHNYKKYITRLLMLGVISMPITPNTLNVIFLLALFSLSIKYKKYLFVFLLLSIPVEYGVYGMLFGWAIYWIKEQDRDQGILFSILVQFIMGISVQAFSLMALPLFLSNISLKLPKVSKYFFYVFYPAHQGILILIVMWINR
ncbi:TraX family protein [Marinilactibacillus psychrotolerans]|nr:TraX family protein [Marinilactibacillus psychrotolerans]SDC31090.1 TraX protein [Marinilactibacillus psychrotolerans]